MAEEFKPIETQDELDNIIKDRLARNTKSVTDEVTKKFEGYISPDEYGKLKSSLSEKDGTIADITAKNKALEVASVKARIAHEFKIPYELADKLSGETEEDIKADAETFSKFIAPKTHTAPLGSTEHPAEDAKKAAYKNLIKGL